MKKSLRYKVFSRDNFICQYCGRNPNEVVLHVDHIIPKAKGGQDEIRNLITACVDCNLGKGATIPGAVTKEDLKERVRELEDRTEQMKAYYKNQKKIEVQTSDVIEELQDYWSELWDYEYSLKPKTRALLRKFLNFCPPNEIKELMDTAVSVVPNDVECSYRYFCGIFHNKRRERMGDEIINS